MERYDFIRTKYGSPLLVDLGRIESLPNYNLSQAPHYITFYEILFITGGTGSFLLDGKCIPLAPQQIIFCAPRQSRQWQRTGPVSGFSLFFEQEFISTFFQDGLFIHQLSYFNPLTSQASLLLEEERFAKCLGMLHELEAELSSLRGDSSHIFRSLLYYLLVFLHRQFQEQTGEAHSEKQQAYKQFLQLLDTKVLHWHRLQDYASQLQLSPATLNRLVLQMAGETAKALIQRRLVLEARRRLLYTHQTVAEIGYALGFSDASNFNRFFKKAEGVSPKSFRALANDQNK